MKNRILILAALIVFLVGIGGIFSPVLAISLGYGDNKIFFESVENVYDSAGNVKLPDKDTGAFPQIVKGDVFLGILKAQNIKYQGVDIWNSSNTDQFTAFFATEVKEVYAASVTPPSNDPFDSTQLAYDHIVLGSTLQTVFKGVGGDDINITGMLNAGEMIALYTQSGILTTPYETNGTLAQDFDVATDGSLWATFGYSPGADGAWGDGAAAADDTGYWYTHAPRGVPIQNFAGETFAGIDIMRDFTGTIWGLLNDPNEFEIGGPLGWIPGILNNMYFNAELTGNEDHMAGNSPWAFEDNDPAHLNNAIPEPCTMLLLGTGLLGLGTFSRRKVKKKLS